VLLARENKRRDAEPPDYSYDNVYVTTIEDEGKRVEVKVSKVRVLLSISVWYAEVVVRIEQEFLDLTDRQNRDFRYVL
jgi:ACS family allantoate permease-like MFS transporter